MGEVENKKFAEDKFFKACCERAGVAATSRQASKWRNKKGSAYRVRNQVNKQEAEK